MNNHIQHTASCTHCFSQGEAEDFTHSFFTDSIVETELVTSERLYILKVQYTAEVHKVKWEKTSHKYDNAASDFRQFPIQILARPDLLASGIRGDQVCSVVRPHALYAITFQILRSYLNFSSSSFFSLWDFEQ